MAHKLKHFCEAVGLSHKYTDGTISAEDCIGKMGKVVLAIASAKDGYPAKNNVRDYLVGDDAVKAAPRAEAKLNEPPPFGDQDVPF